LGRLARSWHSGILTIITVEVVIDPASGWVFYALRAAKKMNHPILLVSQPSFIRFSSIINDMRLYLRLESELISCALWDNSLFPRPLPVKLCQLSGPAVSSFSQENLYHE